MLFALLGLSLEPVGDVMPTQVRQCHPALLHYEGLFALFGIDRFSPASLADFLSSLRTPLFLSWACAALGLFGRWTLLATGMLLLTFLGIHSGCTGTGHAWHLPLYTLLLLACFSTTDRWSLDAFLSERFPRYPFLPAASGTVAGSGLARKLVMLAAIFTLFSAGVSKLWEASPAWMNGESLQNYLKLLGHPAPEARWLYDALLNSQALAASLSVFTLVLELGSIAILFLPRLRFPFVLCAWAFHLGIMLLMLPEYLPQMTCYLLIVDWGKIGRGIFARYTPARNKLDPRGSAPTTAANKRQRRLVRQRAAIAGLGFSALFLGVTLGRREWFPLTHVPMYSSYIDAQHMASYPREAWENAAMLQEISREYIATRRPWLYKFFVPDRIRIRLRGPRGGAPDNLDITGRLRQRMVGGNHALWSARVADFAARDFALGSHRQSGTGPRTHQQPATEARLLALVIPLVQAHPIAAFYRTLDLSYTSPGGREFLLERVAVRAKDSSALQRRQKRSAAAR